MRYKDATGARWFSEIDKGPNFQVWLLIDGEDQELVRFYLVFTMKTLKMRLRSGDASAC